MTREVVEYSSANIANQVDRLNAIQSREAAREGYRHIIVVGSWAPEALAIAREQRMAKVHQDYQKRLSRMNLWTPEELFNPDELEISRDVLSRNSKIVLGVIADTEGEIDAYQRSGEEVFTSPAIKELHVGWVKEERRHDEITNVAKEIILGNNSEIRELVAEFREGIRSFAGISAVTKRGRVASWSHLKHSGLTTEMGHGFFLRVQEGLTAKADEEAAKIADQDYINAGLTPNIGVSTIYRRISPEEKRHEGLGVKRTQIEFSLLPEESIDMYYIVKDGFEMPGQHFIENSRRLPRILYGSLRTYIDIVDNYFDRITKVIFGLSNPDSLPTLAKNIKQLNQQLSEPSIRVVQNDASLQEYKAA